jgi:hypothetical protein
LPRAPQCGALAAAARGWGGARIAVPGAAGGTRSAAWPPPARGAARRMQCLRRLHARLTGSDAERTPAPATCVFCAIAAGEAVDGRRPHLLHQDARVVAFADRAPAAGTHILVCPRDHIVSARHLRAETRGDAELGACALPRRLRVALGAAVSRTHQPAVRLLCAWRGLAAQLRTCCRSAARWWRRRRPAQPRSSATTCRLSTPSTTCTCTALRCRLCRAGSR